MPKRRKLHKPYYILRGYQKKENLTDAQMGAILSCSARTYSDKVNGWGDFTPLESRELSKIFNQSQEVLFS